MDRNLTGGPNFGGLDLEAQKELEDNFHHVSYRISLKIMFNALKTCLNDVRSVKNRTLLKNLARCPALHWIPGTSSFGRLLSEWPT